MIIRDRQYLDNKDLIKGCIKEHQDGLQRMDMLYRAYKGDADILKRTMLNGLPNNRLVHSYPRYIVAIAAGYLVGTPVNYQAETVKLDDLLDAYKAARVDSVDSELAKDASLYGKAVELIYADEKSQVRTSALDPRSAFVVYDNTVENKALLGVRYYQTYDVSGKPAGFDVIVYTDAVETAYHGATLTSALDATLVTEKEHYFGRVPMVEYWNNDDETGDFEAVLTLINAYDKLQSDRLNDNEQLVQALLVITGARIENEPNTIDDNGDVIKGRTAGQALRQDKLLMLPDQTAKAEYLAKPSDGAGADILRKNLKDDIHKFSMIPDLTDENFAANASGVAMKYKLFGLEQLVMVKERWFKEALYERLLIFTNFLSVKGKAKIDYNSINITFKRSLPSNELEIAQMVATLNGIAPRQALMSQLPFIEDAEQAVEELKAEKAEGLAAQQAAFGMPLAQEEEET